MISDALENWKNKNNMFGCEMDERIFSVFCDKHFEKMDAGEVICHLAYAIHELEVCVEGLIEDMEYYNGQKNTEIKKET